MDDMENAQTCEPQKAGNIRESIYRQQQIVGN